MAYIRRDGGGGGLISTIKTKNVFWDHFFCEFFFAKNLYICRDFATFNFANCRPRQTYFITSDFFSKRSFTYTPNLACR